MTQALVPQTEGLSFVMSVDEAKAQLAELQAFVKSVMVEGEDYGIIPGTNKPSLFKSGAEKLSEIYGLAQHIEVVNRIENWEKGFFHYEVKCSLTSKRTGNVVSEGVGSCNSMEARYRWRDEQRKCPACNATSIIKGKEEFGGGWLCWAKKGGCGAKFPDGAPEIEQQPTGKVENDDVFTLVNTILKMAKKRAMVDATISATRSSAIFTQDVEDMPDTQPAARPVTPQRQAPRQPQPAQKLPSIAEQVMTLAYQLGLDNDELKDWLATNGHLNDKGQVMASAIAPLQGMVAAESGVIEGEVVNA